SARRDAGTAIQSGLRKDNPIERGLCAIRVRRHRLNGTTFEEDFMKLSDTQVLIPSSASQRTDHAALLPANLRGSAAKKVVDRLLKEKLLQELLTKDDMPVWRRGDDNRPYSLQITKAGLKAIE